jgi:WD40 repeat protein
VVRLWHGRNSTNGSTLLDPAEASAAAAASGFDLGLAESLMELDGPADSDDQASAIDQTRTGSSSGGLTAAAVAAADANARRRAGRGPYSVVTGEADEGLFDLSMPGQHLRGHIGPVTSLCLTDSCLYSGSWDYTVRVWRRGSWDCVRCAVRSCEVADGESVESD